MQETNYIYIDTWQYIPQESNYDHYIIALLQTQIYTGHGISVAITQKAFVKL